MRENDDVKPPEAIAREQRTKAQVVAGLVIAAAGLAAVFVLKETYLGFGVALVGAGIVPFDKIVGLVKKP